MKITKVEDNGTFETVHCDDGNVLIVDKPDGRIRFVKDKSFTNGYIAAGIVVLKNNRAYLV